MTPRMGSIVANRFELVRELGRGAMGTVWLAEHLTLGVRCAVKFMNTEAMENSAFGANYLARFELEARAIARLGSTNVVRVLDYDMHEGVPFIAMECLQGEDLSARIARVKRLDAMSTYRVISQVANGLAKAHAAGIVHRDLKPENIFLAQDDSGETAKLLDFGVAKLTDLAACEAVTSATRAGALIGTPFYMSPEQARGLEEVDHRADLWSLAVIAFECLTGRLPFYSPALGDLFAKIIFEPLPVPSELDAICTAEFDRWWARAAARDAHDRFRDAREMADALGRALGVLDAPMEAPAEWGARSYRAARPGRASRRAKLLASAVAVALAPLVVTLCSGAVAARSARGATFSQGRSVSSENRAPAPAPAPAQGAAPIVASVATAALATRTSDVGDSAAPANRGPTERAALFQPKAPIPRRAARPSPSAPPDDIDFGI
jgi:serine/threonine protein kinase